VFPVHRTKFYENADIHVSLEGAGVDAETGAPTAVVMYRILKKVKGKIQATKEVGRTCYKRIGFLGFEPFDFLKTFTPR